MIFLFLSVWLFKLVKAKFSLVWFGVTDFVVLWLVSVWFGWFWFGWVSSISFKFEYFSYVRPGSVWFCLVGSIYIEFELSTTFLSVVFL